MVFYDKIQGVLPSRAKVFSFGRTGLTVLAWTILIVLVIVLAGVISYYVIRAFRYKNKIIIFEKVAGRVYPTRRDRAIEIKYGLAGDTVFYLRKHRVYRPRPELSTGKRTYYYFLREDGEWINFTMGDIDLQMKEAKAHFLHPEMRYMRSALLRNLEKRYEKQKFLEKYGTFIISLINVFSIIIIMVFLWLLVDKIIGVGDKVQGMVVSAGDITTKVLDKADGVIARLDNVCTGSGIRSVT